MTYAYRGLDNVERPGGTYWIGVLNGSWFYEGHLYVVEEVDGC